MTRVPEDATLANTSMMINGRYPPDGPALVNVPGTVAGMYRAFKSYGSGKVAWKDLLAPADPRRARRLCAQRRDGDDPVDGARPLPQVRREPRAVLHERQAEGRWRHDQESRPCLGARQDRRRRRRRILQGRSRAEVGERSPGEGQHDEGERPCAIFCRRARARERDVPRVYVLLERAARERRRRTRGAAEPARAFREAEAVHGRRRDDACDRERVAARAQHEESHRRSRPVADRHRADHQQGHGEPALAVL